MISLVFGSVGRVVANMRPWLARLTLHIVHKVGFEKAEALNEEGLTRNAQGHRLDYFQIVSTVLDNFATIFLVPSIILSEYLQNPTKHPQVTDIS